MLSTDYSPQSALAAKVEALVREFDDLQEKTAGLAWCQKSWWENTNLKFSDWVSSLRNRKHSANPPAAPCGCMVQIKMP